MTSRPWFFVTIVASAQLLLAGVAEAQPAAYKWVGKHRCDVESTTGFLAFPGVGEPSRFPWLSFDKSFDLQIKTCIKVGGFIPPEECGEALASEVMTMSATKRPLSAGWHPRSLDFQSFASFNGETFLPADDGRFVYSLSSLASNKRPAIFVAVGRCFPTKN